uniref:Interleukin 23 receptor n=1 Tax=Strigops habroptila TaxID=2489341 RepID=A0A672UUC5_STRHB
PVRMGTNISINCLSTLGCPWAHFSIFFNYSHTEGTPSPLNSSAVQLQLQEFRMPFGSVTCFARCPNTNMDQLVCGTDILAGYPPDPPSNLTCTIQEHAGHMVCAWDTGQTTYLPTQYTLHLHEKEKVFSAGSLIPLSVLHGGNHYSAWVQASNELGAARSGQCPPAHTSSSLPIVVPTLPLVTGAETTETSPPITTIHWKRQTLLENVHCEERYKAMGSPAWHVRHKSCTQHDLQSDTQYVFQVRCRLSTANSPWSAWSSPFLYTTPEAGKLSLSTALFQAAHQPLGMLCGNLAMEREPAHPWRPLLADIRINALVVSLLPKWLLEDIPHMENSSVVKSLQEKSDFLSNSLHKPFLDASDPSVMEIEDVPAHEEYKNMVFRRYPSREVPKDGELQESTVPAITMPLEHISDYKPQVSDGNPPGYVAANIYQTQPPASLPEPETNLFFRDYTSPFPHMWDGEAGRPHVCLLEKINLILNNSQSGQSHTFSSTQGGHSSLLDSQWGCTPASEVQEQMLVPDELLSCLRATNGESVDIKTCFPQNFRRLF